MGSSASKTKYDWSVVVPQMQEVWAHLAEIRSLYRTKRATLFQKPPHSTATHGVSFEISQHTSCPMARKSAKPLTTAPFR